MLAGDGVALEYAENGTPSPPRIPDVVYIPTPEDVIDRMLQLARVTKDDVVYDLGCGDGRIVIAAARDYGCRAVGVDIDPLRVEEAKKNVARHGLGDLVTIRQQDLFGVNLTDATVVTLYLSTRYNTRLVPELAKMRPGSRVVSHLFGIEGIPPDKVAIVRSRHDRHEHTLMLWNVPLQRSVVPRPRRPSDHSLHAHHVQPTAELEADLPKMGDFHKTEPAMQRDTGCLLAVDDRHDRVVPEVRCSLNKVGQQCASDTPSPGVVTHVDRVLHRVTIGRLAAEG